MVKLAVIVKPVAAVKPTAVVKPDAAVKLAGRGGRQNLLASSAGLLRGSEVKRVLIRALILAPILTLILTHTLIHAHTSFEKYTARAAGRRRWTCWASTRRGEARSGWDGESLRGQLVLQ